MSELNTGNELTDVIEETVDDAEVMTVPIDDTLTISGEAADAYAVGQALALKADKADLQTSIKVNGQEPDNQGLILVTAEDTAMSGTDETTIAEAVTDLQGRTGATIPIDSAAGAQSIKDAINSAGGRTGEDIPISDEDSTSITARIGSIAGNVRELTETIADIDGRTGEDIKLYDGVGVPSIAEKAATLEAAMVKSVNDELPDAAGNVEIRTVPYAENLSTEDMQQIDGSFLRRVTGGANSGLSDGNAWVLRIMGNSIHDGFVSEEINLTVIPIPRTTPAAITASIDEETFEAFAQEAGTYTLTYDGGMEEWDAIPADYGLTISNTPIDGDVITIYWDGENDAIVSISAAPRTAPPAITATINRDTFVGYVAESGTITLTYTTAWSEDPSLYGITVVNDPIAGDQIRVVYVKEVRGTIRTATPTRLVGTGWNLYENAERYARVVKYSDTYGYRIGGAYTAVTYAETETGTQTAVTPDAGGLFNVPGDGYVFVDGGDATTYIYTTWSDWEMAYDGDFQSYTESAVNLGTILSANFPYGLCRVGDTRDEIDINAREAIRRIRRTAYSAENLAAVIASGQEYEYDENYIYIVMTTPTVTEITISEEYTVSEHGLEFFDGTTVPVYAEILYGTNLKDKLRRLVVPVTPQTFTAAQQTQARANISAASTSDITSLSDQIATKAAASALTAEVSRAQTAEGKLEVLVVDCGTISSLPTTISNSAIEGDMVVLQSVLGTPSAQTGQWEVATTSESLTISGSISGSTALTLYLMKSRT